MQQWQTAVNKMRFCDHEYLISSYYVNYPKSAEWMCARTAQMVRDEAGVADYLDRVSVLETRYDELIERLKRSEAIGAIPPRSALLASAVFLRETAEAVPTEHAIYKAFADRINRLEDLPDEAREDYLSQCATWLETSLFPATARVADYVEALSERAPDDGGVWRHEGGEDYYRHMLLYFATTTMPPREIHELGLREVERLRGEIFETAAALGFTETESLPALFDAVAEAAGTVTGEETVAYCQALVDDMRERMAGVFNSMPEQELTIEKGSGESSYSPFAGIYTVATDIEKSRHELATTTYHEGYPGHHMQKGLASQLDLQPYRKYRNINAYSEGWALYAEHLAWELGAYDDNPLGNLGRLQYELLRAVRLVVDTGLHIKMWTSQQAFDYIWENTGLEEQSIRDQIARYLVAPGHAVSYMLGFRAILDARDRAMNELGDDFDLAEFHDCILGAGEVPLDLIDMIVDQYIQEKLAGNDVD